MKNNELNNFKFNKKYGQNFIFDTNLLCAIVKDSKINKNDEVLEIGTGAGTLTLQISKVAKKVISYEIDKNLKDFLLEKFQKIHNVEIVFQDALKADLNEIEDKFNEKYHIIANLPYYITTPLIFKFLESQKVASLTVMVQKEVAQRMVANIGTKDYGILSVMLAFYSDVNITRIVNRKIFYPVPNVDSAVVHIAKKPTPCDEKLFSKVVHASFSMRRKTILNNLSSSLKLDKQTVSSWLEKCNISSDKRAEQLVLEDFVNLCKSYFDINS